MSGRRKAKELDTSLFRTPEHIEQDTVPTSGDMSPGAEDEVRVKRASFDLREDQIKALGMLKYSTGKKISELAQEAIDDLLRKYG